MRTGSARKMILRSLCILIICGLGMSVCACGQKESETSGTIFTSIGTDTLSVSSRIAELRDGAAEDILFYLDNYNNEWYEDERNADVRSALGGNRLIGLSECEYLGYCFFDYGDNSDSPVYFIFQVTAIDSTGDETVTRSFYLFSKKMFYKYHNSPFSSVYGSEKIDFSSFSVDGFTSLDSVLAKIKEEMGRDDISEELHLEQDDSFSMPDLIVPAYKHQVIVLFQEADRVYAVFMEDGKPDYSSPVTLSADWFKPEVLAKVEFGTVLSMYYDGIRMESYPLQVDPPYLLSYAGQVEEGEQADLRKLEQDLRDFCTGEK